MSGAIEDNTGRVRKGTSVGSISIADKATSAGDKAANDLYIDNLPDGTTKEDLLDLFKSFYV